MGFTSGEKGDHIIISSFLSYFDGKYIDASPDGGRGED